MLDPLFRRDPQVVQYPNCEGPPLTDEMVAAAERELGVTLPQAYVDLMRTCNGGYTNHAAFGTSQPVSWAADHVSLRTIYGIPAIGDRGEFGTGLGILGTGYMTGEWGLPEGLVLLTGEGHWWIALDYRISGPAGPPTIVWIDVEGGEDVQLTDSFDALLAGLVHESEFPEDERDLHPEPD